MKNPDFSEKNCCNFLLAVLKYILARNLCTFVTEFQPSEEVFGLPNIKSAKKRVLVNQAKAARNKAAKSALKTQLKRFDAAINEGNRVEADKEYKATVKAVDQAAARGLLHKNTAANRKSKMTLRLNKLPQ